MADYTIPGQCEYEGVILSKYFPVPIAERLKELPMEKGDIMVATYPKAGTTWTQEVVWLICKEGDQKEASTRALADRFRPVDLQMAPQAPSELDKCISEGRPYFMKTHLPASIFKKQIEDGKAKFIVCMRNPKDNLVSYYHFYRAHVLLGNFKGSFDDFFELIRAKNILFGDWLDYNLAWWELREKENVLVLKYEDMKKNPRDVIQQIAKYLDKDLSDEVIDDIVQQTSFKTMKENPMVNMSSMPKFVYNHEISPFMRKGLVGDWMNYFNQEQNEYMEQNYIKEAAKHGLHFDFTE